MNAKHGKEYIKSAHGYLRHYRLDRTGVYAPTRVEGQLNCTSTAWYPFCAYS
ncbi:hypothetical protein [Paeniglutamicibacter psychrophenolicus]|uniref:hypothetical protein n=1 Tax=Paeniglutamicibacter psychrophenolicus TaxID=257454 RepID=UPI002784813D|nr:hypothetical protein [Paeniglutamicibacter psychrophenolicus]MDQ0096090.1 hypothetical protein [Paeniglutamicibacter psychrophenolicus]